MILMYEASIFIASFVNPVASEEETLPVREQYEDEEAERDL